MLEYLDFKFTNVLNPILSHIIKSKTQKILIFLFFRSSYTLNLPIFYLQYINEFRSLTSSKDTLIMVSENILEMRTILEGNNVIVKI